MSAPRDKNIDPAGQSEIKRRRYRDPEFVGAYDSRYDTALNDLNTRVERAWIARRASGLVLDAGAGTGRFTAHLKGGGLNVIALDSSQEMLRVLARKAPGLPSVAGDLFRLPLADRSVGTVVCMHVLFHLDDWRTVLCELARVLAPGGRLIFEMRSGEHVCLAERFLRLAGKTMSAGSADPAEATHHARRAEVAAALEACGLAVEARLAYDFGHAHYLKPLSGVIESLLGRLTVLRRAGARTELALGAFVPAGLAYRTLYCGRKR